MYRINYAWFQASAEVRIRSSFFWDVTQRWLIVRFRRFSTTYRSHVRCEALQFRWSRNRRIHITSLGLSHQLPKEPNETIISVKLRMHKCVMVEDRLDWSEPGEIVLFIARLDGDSYEFFARHWVRWEGEDWRWLDTCD
jgi:hypothetical protein